MDAQQHWDGLYDTVIVLMVVVIKQFVTMNLTRLYSHSYDKHVGDCKVQCNNNNDNNNINNNNIAFHVFMFNLMFILN